MGEVWNSHLPKPGAGRPKGARDGVRRPGIKGGKGHGGRSQSAKDADPLSIPGNRNASAQNHAIENAAWADIDKIAIGQRMVHEYLHRPESVEKIQKIIEKQLDKAMTGDQRATDSVLAYYSGKPVAYVARKTESDLSGDSVAAMAEAVAKQLEGTGWRVIQGAAPVPAAETHEEDSA